MKISIIGIGRVGSALAYAIALKGLCHELVLVNRSPEPALGDAYDLHHAMPFLPRQMRVRAGELSATADSDVVVLCASVPMRRDMRDRMELLDGNARLFHGIIPPLAEYSPAAIFLVVSNPVDVLTYLTAELSGFPPSRVVGTGTLIDSARFRMMLSEELSIHPEDLRAYILGEHGPHQFAALHAAEVGGERIESTEARQRMFQEAVSAGFQVLRYKGYTNYGVATAAVTVVEAIAADSHRTMPLSVRVDGWFGVNDVCLSVPVVIGQRGVLRVLHPDLDAAEQDALFAAAAAVRAGIQCALAIGTRTL